MPKGKQIKLVESAMLRAAMRDAIRKELRSRYQPEPEIPEGLMALVMQMQGEEPGTRAAR